MEKKKDLWVIPTDKPSRLYSFYGILEDLSYGKTFTIVNEDIAKINLHKDLKDYQEKLIKAGWKAENIFITSDEEIKKGNWYLEEKSKFNPRKLISEEWGDGQHFKTFNQKGFRKIILTTDPDLINDGVQSIEDDFLEWFVHNPSCEWVEVKKGKMKLNDDGEEYGFPDMSLYKIIIPKEPKQTLEEAAEKWVFETNGHKWSNNDNTAGDNYGSFIAGAKWQAERMYSEEEVIKIVEKSRATGLTAEYLLLTEQFKKK